MYVLQDHPDPIAVNIHGNEFTPVATLKDEFGGISHIAIDDHCYVLYNGAIGEQFRMSSWWYPEAAAAMKQLPSPL